MGREPPIEPSQPAKVDRRPGPAIFCRSGLSTP